MSRTTSEAFREAAFANETDESLICLLTLTPPDSGPVARVSNDPTTRLSTEPLVYGTTSRGESYVFIPFEFTLPIDRDDTPPRVQIALANVGREIVAELRSVSAPYSVKIEVVLAGSPDTVEVELPAMLMADVSYTAQAISITLVVDGLQTEPFPAGQFDRGRFPGLF